MAFIKQPLPRQSEAIVRIKRKGRPCHIAGYIETETKTLVKAVKTMKGYFIRHQAAKTTVHTESCGNCPKESEIRRAWLQDGIDPNQSGIKKIT